MITFLSLLEGCHDTCSFNIGTYLVLKVCPLFPFLPAVPKGVRTDLSKKIDQQHYLNEHISITHGETPSSSTESAFHPTATISFNSSRIFHSVSNENCMTFLVSKQCDLTQLHN